ncbi:MAG: sigma-70 family RNA polymerase sigma factor [Marmoricola sp.]
MLALVRAGDEAAFTELVERYHPRLIRLAGTFVGGRDLVEDVAQETWLAVLRGVDAFEGRSSFKTWLFQICANRARSIAVREQRIVPVEDVTLIADQPVFAADGSWQEPPHPWATDALDRADLVAAVQAAIRELPFTQRQVITLRDVEGLSAEEVCAVLVLTDANQRVLLHRARLRVRSILGSAVLR